MTNRTALYLILAMAVMLSSLPTLVSCNKNKDDDDDTFYYSTSKQTTLVTGFALQASSDVLANLDSVRFTIDYDNGLIYNADSLPVGTDISKLKVVVEFLNTVKSAVFNISDATVQADTSINYTTSMTQPIDFTGKTLLKVTSADETQVKDYEIKVLVHQVEPDTLIWAQSWRRDLPGYSSGVTAFKAVEQDGKMFAMTYDGNQCALLTASSPSQATWDKQTLSLPFTPNVSTLTATGSALFVLADDGTLYTSANAVDWASCGVNWCSLLGAYEDRVLGLVTDGSAFYHDEYPRPEGFENAQVDQDFPVAHASNMITVTNNWSVGPQAMIVGGIDSNGDFKQDTWGYDGSRWGKINNIHSDVMPALADASLFSYYTYKTLPGVRRYARQTTWYVMGGRKADGTLNSDIYLSNSQGITWFEADSMMVQPDFMPKFYGAQVFVADETMNVPKRMPRQVASLVTSWQCPYIYLYGGYDADGALLPNVWRGVYNRLTNAPVY